MRDRIENEINHLFRNAPSTRRVREAHEELLAGCLDKYEDLVASGESPEEAYRIVIEGIGDVDELVRTLEDLDAFKPQDVLRQKNKRVLCLCIGIFLGVIALAFAGILQGVLNDNLLGGIFLLIMGTAAVVVVYGYMTTSVKFEKQEDTMTEEFKEKLVRGTPQDKLLSAISSALWSFIVIVFLCAGLFFELWHPAWMIFPIGLCIQLAITALFKWKDDRKKMLSYFFWLLIIVVYLLASIITGRWGITWMLFPLGICIRQLVKLLDMWRSYK